MRPRWRRLLRGARPQPAAKAALAAMIAWQVGLLLPDEVNEYSYYAPLGAVVAMYPTLASSAGAAIRSLLGILLGVGIALIARSLHIPDIVTIAVVVGAGGLIGGARILGDQRSWVPMTALFVLLIGDADPSAFALGYVGQLLLGAAIGTAINLVMFPPLFLADAYESLESAQHNIIEQLGMLADGLEHHTEARGDAWLDRSRNLEPALVSMRQALSERLRAAAAEMSAGIENLVADLRNHDVEHSSDPFAAASVVHQLRRCRRAFEADRPLRPSAEGLDKGRYDQCGMGTQRVTAGCTRMPDLEGQR